MTGYIIRRLLLLMPTVFFVVLIVFFMFQLIPGDVVDAQFGQMEYSALDLDKIKASMGLDQPVHIRFGRWLGQLLRGDLGNSLWTTSPVLDEILPRIPVSVELGLLALIISMLIGVPIGTYSAMRQDTTGDYITRSAATLAICVPSFWLAIIIMVYPSIWWNWTPHLEYIAFTDDPAGNLFQFLIPATILGMLLAGTLTRMTRSMMLEVLRQDYIRTAWSKGLRERVVILRHALKNSLIPVISLISVMIPGLIGGTVVLEQIFNLPGLGRYLLIAIGHRDYVALAGLNVLIAMFVVFVNLLFDLSYAYLDPRIKYP